MATVTVATMTTRARQRADMVNSRFVTDAEVADFLDIRNKELYGKLIEHDLLTNDTVQTITANGSAYYAYPSSYYSTLDVYYQQASGQELVRLERLSHRDRPQSAGGDIAAGYRLGSDGLRLYPSSITGTYLHYYVPSPDTLVSGTPTTGEASSVNYPMGWEAYIIIGAAVDMLAKEETTNPALQARLDKIEAKIIQEARMREAAATNVVQNVDSEYMDTPPRWATRYRGSR